MTIEANHAIWTPGQMEEITQINTRLNGLAVAERAVWTPGQREEIIQINARLDRLESRVQSIEDKLFHVINLTEAIAKHLGIPIPDFPSRRDFGDSTQQ